LIAAEIPSEGGLVWGDGDGSLAELVAPARELEGQRRERPRIAAAAHAGQHPRDGALGVGNDREASGCAVEPRRLGPAALAGRERFEQLRQALRVGGEDRRGLFEGLPVGDDGHAALFMGEDPPF
jgi:hypothetical protein